MDNKGWFMSGPYGDEYDFDGIAKDLSDMTATHVTWARNGKNVDFFTDGDPDEASRIAQGYESQVIVENLLEALGLI